MKATSRNILLVAVLIALGHPGRPAAADSVGPPITSADLLTNVVPAISNYCAQMSLARVCTDRFLKGLPEGAERTQLQAEIQKARQFLKTLRMLNQQLQSPTVTPPQKAKCLVSLSEMNRQLTRPGEIGAGNLEASTALSMVITGNFLACMPDLDPADCDAVIRALHLGFTSLRPEDIRAAINSEKLPMPALPANASTEAVVKALAFGSPSTNDIGNTTQMLAHRLARSPRSIAEQLESCDPDWLVWDILLGNRLTVYCQLAPFVPGESKSDQDARKKLDRFLHEGFESVAPWQKDLLLPTTRDIAGGRVDYELLLELKEHMKARGKLILLMTDSRLREK